MSHPCQFNVYVREVGKKRILLGSFRALSHAVNYGCDMSRGLYNVPTYTLLVLDMDRTIHTKFVQGVICR